MALRVTEFGGYASGRPFGAVSGGPIQTQMVTIGAFNSTFNLSSATRLILVDTDAGAFLFVGSSGSTVVPSGGSSGSVTVSTAGASFHIFPNQLPFPIYVNPYSRLVATST